MEVNIPIAITGTVASVGENQMVFCATWAHNLS